MAWSRTCRWAGDQQESKARIEALIAAGVGGREADGGWPRRADCGNTSGKFREAHGAGWRAATSELTHTEIFGPVLSLMHADDR